MLSKVTCITFLLVEHLYETISSRFLALKARKPTYRFVRAPTPLPAPIARGARARAKVESDSRVHTKVRIDPLLELQYSLHALALHGHRKLGMPLPFDDASLYRAMNGNAGQTVLQSLVHLPAGFVRSIPGRSASWNRLRRR